MTSRVYSFYEIAGKFVPVVDENGKPTNQEKFDNFRKKRQKYFEEILVKAKTPKRLREQLYMHTDMYN